MVSVMTRKNTTVGNWGRWGADDQRGALNLLTPERVREAATVIRTGRVYSLGIPIQPTGVPLLDHRGRPMRLTLQDATDEGIFARYGCADGTGSNEDVMIFASHTTSHMDALIHVYEDHKHYNGFDHSAMKALAGATKLGIENVGGFAARAVILDLPRYFGEVNDWIEPGRMLSADELSGCAQSQGTEVRAGDVVLVRTGHLQFWYANQADPGHRQAGIGVEAAEWLADRDVVAVGSDNAAVEVIPFDGNDMLAVHKVLLVQRGIYMLEFLDLSGPAAERAYEGLITVAPLMVTGATGSPVNPVFIA